MAKSLLPTGPPGLRERKKQRTKEQIADAAWSLFVERGFERVTVPEVAASADVSEQTVFNHFPTKEDLVYWRMGAFEDELLDAIRDRASGETVLAAFGRFMHEPRGLLDHRNATAYARAIASTRMIKESPALQTREQIVFAAYTDALATIIADDEAAGVDDVTPWIAANAIMGVHRAVVGYARRRLSEGVTPQRLARDVRSQVDHAIALLERGLR